MKIKSLLTFMALALPALSIAHAQTTVFTYQGRALDNGTNFNGTGQFEFALVTSTNNNHTATATASLSAPFITSYNVTAGGNGYAAPLVTVTGGGMGATATANLTGGVVTSLTPGSAGTGYTSVPTVSIAPPPANVTYTTYWSNDGTGVNGSEPAAAVNVAVNNGLFTVVLGDTTQSNMAAINAGLFNQPNLQLRIWFNDGANGFAALDPVQNLTPTPYAVYAANAGIAGSANSVSAANIVGTIPATQLPASVITNDASGVTITGTFSGNGAGVTNVPGTLAQVVASGTSFTAQANTAYDLTNSGEVSVSLPTNANVGDVIQVNGTGAGAWQVMGSSVVYWTEQTGAPTSGGWQSVASSSDGTHLVAVQEPGGVYTSANSGVTWTQQTGAPNPAYWSSVASSSDGTHLVAVSYNGGIYTSTNSGVTWTEQTGAPTSVPWFSVASSSDGTHLVAVINNGGIYTSTNTGVTWTEQTGAPALGDWSSVASSSDGTHLVALWTAYGGGIYTSANSGVTWTKQTGPPSGDWSSVASSSDGTHLVAVVSGGGIYIYTSAVSGAAGTSEQFQYLGNGVWQPLPPTAGYLSNNGSTVQSLNNVVTNGASGVNITGTFSGNGAGVTNVPLGALNGSGLISWGSFHLSSSPGVGSTPDSVIAVDVNGDGHVDLISANAGANTLTILTNNGYGVFGSNATLNVGFAPYSVCTADVNGDGHVDLISANFIDNTLTVLTNNGFGVFGFNATLNVGSYPACVVAADVNGDGHVDLISANNDTNTLTVLVNVPNYNGTFSGNGSGLTSVPAGSLTGTIADGLLSANVALRAGGNHFTGNQIITSGYLGIGLTSPTYPLEVASNGVPQMTLDSSGNLECAGTVYSRGIALTSDRNLKENFTAVDDQTVLAKVAALPLSEWNYKTDRQGVQHLGPMAQDFHSAFGLDGADDQHISVVDEGGVALAAIQGLNQKVDEKEARIQEQASRIQNQAAEIAELKQRLEALEKIIPPQKLN